MAPAVGFEPTTNRLTADRSTTELRWIFVCRSIERREFCAARLLRQVRLSTSHADRQSLFLNLIPCITSA